MEYVTLVNRTSKTLKGTWDGKHYEIVPGKNEYPVIQAEAFRRQNPLMGSQDPFTMEMQYLVGIVEQGDEITPLEQSSSIELMDRAQMAGARPTEVVRGNTGGMYSSPLPAGNGKVGQDFSR